MIVIFLFSLRFFGDFRCADFNETRRNRKVIVFNYTESNLVYKKLLIKKS